MHLNNRTLPKWQRKSILYVTMNVAKSWVQFSILFSIVIHYLEQIKRTWLVSLSLLFCTIRDQIHFVQDHTELNSSCVFELCKRVKTDSNRFRKSRVYCIGKTGWPIHLQAKQAGLSTCNLLCGAGCAITSACRKISFGELFSLIKVTHMVQGCRKKCPNCVNFHLCEIIKAGVCRLHFDKFVNAAS